MSCRRANGNMLSAMKNPQPVNDFPQTKVEAGRVMGPDIPNVQTSRFSVIPKQGQPGECQLILDLSSPHDLSMNNGVTRDLCSMLYAMVDNVIGKVSYLEWTPISTMNMPIETS